MVTIHYSVSKYSQNVEILQFLVDNYPQHINVVSSLTKRNILDYNFLNNLRLTEYLIEKGATVDVTSDIYMETLLHCIAEHR